MKTQIISGLLLICLLSLQQKAVSQATTNNNNNGTLDFLGGNNLSTKNLDIGQENALSIDFYTGTLGTYPWALPNNRRMQIFDAAVMPNSFTNPGFVGIGDIGFAAFSPLSRLHLHDNTPGPGGNFIYEQWTNANTGSSYLASNGAPFLAGLQVGIDALGNGQIRQQSKNLPLQFYLNSNFVSTTFEFPSERMIIHAGPEQVNLQTGVGLILILLA